MTNNYTPVSCICMGKDDEEVRRKCLKSVKIMSPTHPLSYVVILSVQLIIIKSECCNDIAISSSSTASSYQENQIGIYSIKPDLRVNDRPVYKQNKGNLYVYYWVMFSRIV